MALVVLDFVVDVGVFRTKTFRKMDNARIRIRLKPSSIYGNIIHNLSKFTLKIIM